MVCHQEGLEEVPNAVAAIDLDPAANIVAVRRVEVGYPANYNVRVVDDRLTVFDRDDDGTRHWLSTVGRDGRVEIGEPAEVGFPSAYVIGPDGRGYLFWDGGITAMDLSGVVSGWPANVPGVVDGVGPDVGPRSKPAFSPAGDLVLTRSTADGNGTQVVVVGRAGEVRDLGPALQIDPVIHTSGLALEYFAIPPLVGPGGSVTVVGQAGADVAIHRVDASGAIPAGWPFRTPGSVGWRGTCENVLGDGCGTYRALPVVAGDGTVYVPLGSTAPSSRATVLAVGPDGRARTGWPATIGSAGSWVWGMAPGAGGVLFALVVHVLGDGTETMELLAISAGGSIASRALLSSGE